MTFRDYLTDRRVPHIPWSRTFQRDARTAIAAVQAIKRTPKISSAGLAKELGGTGRGVVNVLSDLVALQLVERVADDSYVLCSHVKGITPKELAEHIHGQFSRHLVCRELASYDRDTAIRPEDLDAIVRRMKPPGTKLSDNVVHQYAMNLKRWLLFAGHLEERGNQLFRPQSKGAQMGIVSAQRMKKIQFMGCGTTDGLLKLLRMVSRKRGGIEEKDLRSNGLRNALYDAVALGLVGKSDEGRVFLLAVYPNPREADLAAKNAVLRQPAIQVIEKAISDDSEVTNTTLGVALQKALKTQWKPASALRYANGLRGYYSWATS